MKSFKESKILIVDDNPQNINVLASFLQEKKLNFAIARSGVRAINLAKMILPDVILLDIMMPQMDGYETCRLLKQNKETRHIPIIFLSAKNQTEDIINGFESGGVDYLSKPFNKGELFARLRTHTDLKHSKDEIKTMVTKLEETNRAKDKLFSIISHDLRGPLANIKMLVDLFVKNDIADEKKQYYFEQLQKTNESTMELLENLLLWSRNETGTIQSRPQKYPVQELININLLNAIAISKNISINYDIERAVTTMVDKDMLRTVIRNLVSNAVKFSFKDNKIDIKARRAAHNINITVQDYGVGMAEKEQKKVFDTNTFYSTRGTQQEQGNGLGLILCREFVKKNKGTLLLKSQKNEGTTFTISLPSLN